MSPRTRPPPALCNPPDDFSLVLVGSSLGGPAALASLVGALSSEFHAAIVVVQHAPASVARPLVRRLAGACPLDVVVVEDQTPLRMGRVHVAPGGAHVELEGDVLRTRHTPPEHGCRPAVDVLFRSARGRPGVVAVVLTGMGSDGLSGARTLRRHGARVLAQDAASSAVWGMAGQVVRAGLADAVGAPRELGALLESWSVRHRVARGPLERATNGSSVNPSATSLQSFDAQDLPPSGKARHAHPARSNPA